MLFRSKGRISNRRATLQAKTNESLQRILSFLTPAQRKSLCKGKVPPELQELISFFEPRRHLKKKRLGETDVLEVYDQRPITRRANFGAVSEQNEFDVDEAEFESHGKEEKPEIALVQSQDAPKMNLSQEMSQVDDNDEAGKLQSRLLEAST